MCVREKRRDREREREKKGGLKQELLEEGQGWTLWMWTAFI